MISVLTVNYHSAAELKQLADSLVKCPSRHEIELIVTNNSPEEPIQLDVPNLCVTILDSENLGYAAGINRAFAHARGEFFLVANPDLCVTAGAIDAAIDHLERLPDAGLILPRLRYPDGRIQPSVRRFYTWPVILYARTPLRRLNWQPAFFRNYLHPEVSQNAPTEVDWGLGGAMFLRRADCLEGRIFDERYFLYFEDVDLCLAMWRRGRRVLYCTAIECIHDHRRASKHPISHAGWHHFRSLVRFILKHRGLPQRP